LSYWKGVSAALVLPLVAAVAFAPPTSGGTDPARPATVDSSIGPIPLPGNAVAPSTLNTNGPIEVPSVGISNFGVVDGMIFRGEQPRRGDYAALAKLGVKTVVDLRLDAHADSRSLAESAGLRYVNIPIDDHKQPSDADVAAFMKVIDDPERGAIYVHCAGGRHRTGSMIAVYRMVHDGWTVDQAYDEMLKYDFYTSNGHGGFKTYVFDYYTRMKADPASVPVAYVAPVAVPVQAVGQPDLLAKP